ncbi:unnamed protein product [Ambrosiozyma monospora]|uniref:Unnamed protein product n=1 Tax=Ambrosiozyma monospora TaxID=43982 RepID=A0ACB5SXH7_AMBMO|nr:unnamed protein product [Ambrosiozyma monospora]
MLQVSNFALTVVAQLTLELQCVVLKLIILSYLTENTDDWELIDEYYDFDMLFNRHFDTRLLKRPLHCLYELCGCDEILDSILTQVIQELVFDSTITDSPIFKSFVDYIISKSVKIHVISTRQIAGSVNDETRFFDQGCLKFEAYYRLSMRIENPNYMCHVTSLTCDPMFLDHLRKGIMFQDMVSLTEMRILMDFDRYNGISDSMRVLDAHPEWLQEIAGMKIRKILEIRLSYEGYYDLDDYDDFIGDFIDLFEGFKIEIDPRSSTCPSLNYFKDLVDRNMNHSWFFRIPLTDQHHKEIKTNYSPIDHFIQSITLSNPSIEVILLYSICETEQSIHFKGMSSLKELTLRNGSISLNFLNRLPETLHKLTIWCVNLAESSRDDVNLPTHLQNLVIRAYEDGLSIFEIGNSNELVNLREVSICLKYSTYTDEQLRPFIHSLPTSVNRLNLQIGKAGIDDGDYSGLRLNELHCMKYSSFESWDCNLSWLPPSIHLKVGDFSFDLEGQFPKMLKSLDIQVEFPFDDYGFPEFWKDYISPIENLHSLKCRVVLLNYLDFRGLEFPKHLHTIELVMEYGNVGFSFDYIPSSLRSFCFIIQKVGYERPTEVYSGEFLRARKYKQKAGGDSFHDRKKLNQVFYASAPYFFKWKLEGEQHFTSNF